MGNQRDRIRKSFLGLIFLVVVMNGLLLFSGPGANEEIPIKDLFSNHIFDVYGIMKNKALVLAMENLMFIVYFNLFFGNYIYNYFVKGSVFTFSRIQNRRKWCWKQSIQLYGISVIFAFLYLVMQLGVSMYSSMQMPDLECLKSFLIFWAAFSVILMLSTFSINLCAIQFGTVKAFLMVYVCMVVLMKLSIHFEDIPILKDYYIAHIVNPMSAMSLILIKGKILKLGAILYYHLLIVGIVYFAGNFIKKMDILHMDK